jgi:DNA helicase-2/ATP-dependent DNA helicase PcrA
MNELLKQKEQLLLTKNKYLKKIFQIDNQIIQIEKDLSKISEHTLIESLTLSEQQTKIVDANDQNMLVIACPGAGKTHTLISRYVNLILKKNVKPESVLLITFTKKAGQEMQKRLEDIIPDKLPFHVGSLHGLGYRILQKYNNINYTVLDELETKDLLKNECINYLKTLDNLDKEDENIINLKIFSVIDHLSITYPLNLKQVLKKLNLSKFNTIISTIYKLFTKKKKLENLVDFNDLMIMFCDFLKNSKSQDFINSIKYIFFDEYQDINPIQNFILSIFKDRSNIMVVGDDAQSIYSFRGSSVNFILDFPKLFLPNNKYLLVENYRSTPAIVNFCENIIKNNTNQYEKNVKSIQIEYGIKPDIYEFNYKNKQYEWVINDIIQKVNNGVKLSQIVILARKNNLITQIEVALLEAKIPYVKQLGIALLDKPHIKDFLAFIIILFNPKSSIHFKRIISLHKNWNINSANQLVESTDNIINKIKQLNDIYLNELLLLLSNLNNKKNNDYDQAKDILLYLEKLWLNKHKDIKTYVEDVRFLLTFLKNYTLTDFITNLYLNQEIETTYDNVLFLSTVHGSKGLEWEHVYLIDVNNGDFPAIRSNQYYEDELNEMEEERRLFYVACSRAKKYLTITYDGVISPFIRELNDDLYLGNNIKKSKVELSNIIPKDITLILRNHGHKNVCNILKTLVNKEKIISGEWNLPIGLYKHKMKHIIGSFIDYLIPKILQNNYPEKIKKFDLNLIHRDQNFSKKIYYDYIDINNHWTNLLEVIFYISSYQIEYENQIKPYKDFLVNKDQFIFYKELEIGIKKIIDMFKPKQILNHYNINFDTLKGEIDLLLDDILIEIKVSNFEVCTLQYMCQILTYGYLMKKKGIKINKVCIYNIQSGILNIFDTSNFNFDEFYLQLFLS